MTDPTRATLPFQKVTDDRYAPDFADSSDVAPFSRGVVITGDCPRCGHEMRFPVVDRIFLSVGTAAAHPDRDGGDEPMLCLCDEAHPDCPDGEKGCGAYWAVVVPSEAW